MTGNLAATIALVPKFHLETRSRKTCFACAVVCEAELRAPLSLSQGRPWKRVRPAVNTRKAAGPVARNSSMAWSVFMKLTATRQLWR
jgi:hypothetical protein